MLNDILSLQAKILKDIESETNIEPANLKCTISKQKLHKKKTQWFPHTQTPTTQTIR